MKSLQQQNDVPAFRQIADPYIGFAHFQPIGESNAFHNSPFIYLMADFWTLLMIDFL